MVKYIPEKGDIVSMNFTPNAGVEQGGVRPAIIISNKHYNKSGLVLACPITRKIKGFRYEIPLPTNSKIEGVILTNHLTSRDASARGVRFICKAPKDIIDKVVKFIQAFIKSTN